MSKSGHPTAITKTVMRKQTHGPATKYEINDTKIFRKRSRVNQMLKTPIGTAIG